MSKSSVFLFQLKKLIVESGQDGGVGRNPSLPRTTKRRITTNLKSINNQKCQKIKLHGTPTTKEWKKESTRPTKLVRWVDGENPQESCRLCGWGCPNRKWDSELTVDYWWGLQGLLQWEKPPFSQEGSLESGARAKQASCIVPSLAPPTQTARRVALPR